MKKCMLVLSVVLLAGCATKQYPILAPVSADEARLFDCDTLSVEVARAQSTRAEIDEIGKFSPATVIGVLGDFGVGNGIAKSNAIEKADARLLQLRNLQTSKGCE